jgi:hypothetical protein
VLKLLCRATQCQENFGFVARANRALNVNDQLAQRKSSLHIENGARWTYTSTRHLPSAMTLLHLADADPDPTTQIPWPCRHGRRTLNSLDISQSHCEENVVRCTTSNVETRKRLSSKDALDGRRLTTWNLITLSIAMAGSQIAWTVELGYGYLFIFQEAADLRCSYGTPFLLSLGLSEQLTSLVWLAGPISGLITQPVVGMHSLFLYSVRHVQLNA